MVKAVEIVSTGAQCVENLHVSSIASSCLRVGGNACLRIDSCFVNHVHKLATEVTQSTCFSGAETFAIEAAFDRCVDAALDVIQRAHVRNALHDHVAIRVSHVNVAEVKPAGVFAAKFCRQTLVVGDLACTIVEAAELRRLKDAADARVGNAAERIGFIVHRTGTTAQFIHHAHFVVVVVA